MNKKDILDIVTELSNNFRKSGIMCKTDCGSSNIGKRYARTDELGIPFGVTIDLDTIEKKTVTVREINSMK